MSNKSNIITGKGFDQPDEIRRPLENDKIEVVAIGGESCHNTVFILGQRKFLYKQEIY